jgi:hypothetical protein
LFAAVACVDAALPAAFAEIAEPARPAAAVVPATIAAVDIGQILFMKA